MNTRQRLENIFDFTDNDASSSAFGWKFQLLSAIPLLFYNIKKVDHFIIEGKYQDIEIFYDDDSRCFVQAKAIQMKDSEDNSTKNRKFKQAIISLFKSPFINNEKIIYASNFKSPILDDSELYKNKLVGYSDCPPSIKNQIDNLLVESADLIDLELNKKIDECAKNNKAIDNKYKNGMNELSKRLRDDTNKNNIFFYSLYPFFGEDSKDQSSVIADKIIAFLSNDIGFHPGVCIALSNKLLRYWESFFLDDASMPNSSVHKVITKDIFLWPVVLFNSSFSVDIIEETMKGRITSSDKMEADYYLNDDNVFLNLQGFRFLHKLYKEYNEYRKSDFSLSKTDIDFVLNKWNLFKDEFTEYTKSDIQLEYITKNYIYRLIKDYNNSDKLNRGANLWK